MGSIFIYFKDDKMGLFPINFDFSPGYGVGQKSSQVPGGGVVVRLDVVAGVHGPGDDLQIPDPIGDREVGLPQNPSPVSRRRGRVLRPLELGLGPAFATVGTDVNPDDGIAAAGISVTPDADTVARIQRDSRPVLRPADGASDGDALDGRKLRVVGVLADGGTQSLVVLLLPV